MKYEFKKPDYDDSIAGIPNSVLKAFDTETVGKTSPLTDRVLDDNTCDNIVVFLLDGMGKNVLDGNLEPDGFFNSHLQGTLSSVFLSTTVAATTSAMSGLTPCEHAWLGWDCYYPLIDKNVAVFLNNLQSTETPAADYPIAWTYCPYKDVVTRLNENGKEAYYSMPFQPPFPQDPDSIFDRIKELCAKPGKKYIYAYWSQPDSIFHQYGCFGKEAKDEMRMLEKRFEELAAELTNTLILVTADHGHIDVDPIDLTSFPKIMDCMIRMPALEPRAATFFIKEGRHEEFTREFNKEFADWFDLIPTEEAIEQGFFGRGQEHPNFRKMLGDYIAYSTSDKMLAFTEEDSKIYKGFHGAPTKDEMTIPLIAIECKGE